MSTFRPGQRLGPYELLGQLGTGGMGVVWRARDPRLGREVAIKVLLPDRAADSEMLQRFEQEARSASALNHPNIVTVHDLGREGQDFYIAMELVQGRSVRELLAEGPLPLRRALSIAAQVADGLAQAHAAGIVHRDLKPENVMVSKDGLAKILDFGLAKLSPWKSSAANESRTLTFVPLTEPGIVLGTFDYMSPEQARGAPVEFESDQFAFGLLLYEMTTGRPAFSADSPAETLAAIIREEPESIAKLLPGSPPPLHWIIERCLAKDPTERFASTRDLARDLKTLHDRFREVSSSSEGVSVSSPDPRRLGASAIGVAAASLLALALGGAMWLRRPAPAAAPSLRFLTYSGHDAEPAASPDGRFVAFSSDRDGRRRIWLKQLADGSENPLTEGEDAYPRFSPDGASLLFIRATGMKSDVYRIAAVGGEPRRLLEDAVGADWAPDGRIAFLRWKRSGDSMASVAGVAAADGSAAREIVSLAGRVLAHPRWSPDGRQIAAVQNSRSSAERSWVVFIDASSGTHRDFATPQHSRVSSVAWLGSGAEVLYLEAESAVGAMLASSARLYRQSVRSGPAVSLLWSPASGDVLDILAPGRVVLDARSPRQNLREFSLTSDPPVPNRLTLGNGTDRQPVYAPDGEWIAFSSNRSGNLDLWAISTRTGAVKRLTEDPADDWDPAFSPDGKHLLWSSNRSGNLEVWIAAADGSGARQLTHDGASAANPAVSPDNRWVYYGSGRPRERGIWRIGLDGSPAKHWVHGPRIFGQPSPDGRTIAFLENYFTASPSIGFAQSSDGALLDFRIPVVVRDFTPSSPLFGRFHWTPNGRGIAFVGQNEAGLPGVYVADFRPGEAVTPRPLAGFDREAAAESFGISPDGSRIAIASWEQMSSLLAAEPLPGVDPPRRRAR